VRDERGEVEAWAKSGNAGKHDLEEGRDEGAGDEEELDADAILAGLGCQLIYLGVG
jgi:hypothetical protein